MNFFEILKTCENFKSVSDTYKIKYSKYMHGNLEGQYKNYIQTRTRKIQKNLKSRFWYKSQTFSDLQWPVWSWFQKQFDRVDVTIYKHS